jgi:DeoR/GlpR family transcriptional regulator of sugar metabolism
MLSNTERQQTLVKLLARQGRLSVADVCERYSISEATARRDLDALAEQGLLQRVHGGAIPLRPAEPELPILRALNLEQGLTNDYLPETLTDRAILSVAREIILVADHTEIGAVAPAFLAPLKSLHVLVTDRQADPVFLKALEEQNIRVMIV